MLLAVLFKLVQPILNAILDTNAQRLNLVVVVQFAVKRQVEHFTSKQLNSERKTIIILSATVCALQLDVGRSCTAQVPRPMQMWYFSSASRTCQQFSFNGCGGNSNNFETQSECLTFCGGATSRTYFSWFL